MNGRGGWTQAQWADTELDISARRRQRCRCMNRVTLAPTGTNWKCQRHTRHDTVHPGLSVHRPSRQAGTLPCAPLKKKSASMVTSLSRPIGCADICNRVCRWGASSRSICPRGQYCDDDMTSRGGSAMTSESGVPAGVPRVPAAGSCERTDYRPVCRCPRARRCPTASHDVSHDRELVDREPARSGTSTPFGDSDRWPSNWATALGAVSLGVAATAAATTRSTAAPGLRRRPQLDGVRCIVEPALLSSLVLPDARSHFSFELGRAPSTREPTSEGHDNMGAGAATGDALRPRRGVLLARRDWFFVRSPGGTSAASSSSTTST